MSPAAWRACGSNRGTVQMNGVTRAQALLGTARRSQAAADVVQAGNRHQPADDASAELIEGDFDSAAF